MNSIRIFTFLILSLINCVENQDFCQKYLDNNRKVSIFSVDNRKVFVFVDKYFWILTEQNKRLSFSGSNGMDERLANRMSALFHVYLYDDNNQVVEGIAFYDVRR